MKRNIFVLRTQYNLIMGYAVLSTFPNNEKNDLIVQPEFDVSEELKSSLEKNFDRVLILKRYRGKTVFQREKELWDSLNACRHFITQQYVYSRIVFAQERFLETMLLSRLFSMNKGISIESVEEDAYYSLNPYFNNKDKKKKWIKKGGELSISEKIFFKIHQLFFWKDTFYYPSYAYGIHPRNSVVHVQYPEQIRDELKNKIIVPVTTSAICYGIKKLYGNIKVHYPDNKEYLLLFFDLMDRYKNPELIQKIAYHYINWAQENNIYIIVKYHPRETNKFIGLGELYEVDYTIPAEKILYDFVEKKVTVLCNATTVGLVAAKLGMEVISTAKIDLIENMELHKVWESLGIKMLEGNEF